MPLCSDSSARGSRPWEGWIPLLTAHPESIGTTRLPAIPTNAPSTSSCATISPTFLALAEPPYRTRTDPATSAFAICANSARIAAHTSCASAALATRPVPMAHTGS
ncbi:Uncharacterised protein [Mycobacteroides abscessus subsp. abscessus]|nr:Uncharacterised protein [Mycobacteroides abscessus subsp. abscessus]